MAGAMLAAAAAGGISFFFLADHIAGHRDNDHHKDRSHKNGTTVVGKKV